MQATQYLSVFKALADPTRLQIVAYLKGRPECCACELVQALDIKQPTLSRHMAILSQAQLVNARRDGQWMRYALNAALWREVGHFWQQTAMGK